MSDKDILYKTALENKEKVNLNYLTIFAERIHQNQGYHRW